MEEMWSVVHITWCKLTAGSSGNGDESRSRERAMLDTWMRVFRVVRAVSLVSVAT